MRRTTNSEPAAKDRLKKILGKKQRGCGERPLLVKVNIWQRGPTAMEVTQSLNTSVGSQEWGSRRTRYSPDN